jgi:hypothetical protein
LSVAASVSGEVSVSEQTCDLTRYGWAERGLSKRETSMLKILPFATLAAAIALAGPALAQVASPAGPGALAPLPTPPASAVPQAPGAASTAVAPLSATAPTPAAPAPSASASARTGASADTAANAGASTSLTTGMSVKDNAGALIGEVKSLKGGVATIQMGSDSFTVDANKLGVAGGAATINASQAELKKMLPKK